MITFIVDLFHPYPEDLGDKGAAHDILGTSESGVQLSLHYKKTYRLYYCEDIVQEERAIKWHLNDLYSTQNQLTLLDVCRINDLAPELNQAQGNIRLIINGQGCIDPVTNNDTVGGLNAEDFSDALDTIMAALKINGKKRQLAELVVFSCKMAHSNSFVSLLQSKFQNEREPFKLVLFKHIISFSQDKLFSFFDEVGSREDTLENLSFDCASVFQSDPKENRIDVGYSPLSIITKRSKTEANINVTQRSVIDERKDEDLRATKIRFNFNK
jgi:hypothetical protein